MLLFLENKESRHAVAEIDTTITTAANIEWNNMRQFTVAYHQRIGTLKLTTIKINNNLEKNITIIKIAETKPRNQRQ